MLAMTTSRYIAETDEAHQISTVWVEPRGRKPAKIFNLLVDLLDPSKVAKFDEEPEADIKGWITVQKAISTR